MSLVCLTLAHIKSLSDERDEMSSRVRDLLRHEHIIRLDGTQDFCAVIKNFHGNGTAIFSRLEGAVSYFAETKDGLTLIEANETHDQSLLSMEVLATLVRLSDDKHAKPKDKIFFSEENTSFNQDVDFKYLFENAQQEDVDLTWHAWENVICGSADYLDLSFEGA